MSETIAGLQAQLQAQAAVLARLQPLLERHDRLACQAVVMTATSKLDRIIHSSPAANAKHSSLAQDVAGLCASKLTGLQQRGIFDGHGDSQTHHAGHTPSHDFTQQEMSDAVARRQGSDASSYLRLFQFAFSDSPAGPQ